MQGLHPLAGSKKEWEFGFSGPDVWQWIISLFLWASVPPSMESAVPIGHAKEGQKTWTFVSWAFALSVLPKSVAE